MNEKQKTLLLNVLKLFMQLGIKSQTMDDISSKLGISKKTLYQFVSNKEDLVNQTLSLFIEMQEQQFKEALQSGGNAIDKFIAINNIIGRQLKELHPSVLFDVQKYYPTAWKKIRAFKLSFISEIIKTNLKEGINENLYRNNLNIDIVTFMYVTMADNLFSQNHLSYNYSMVQLHSELVRYHIRGIANENGIKYLIQKLNNDNEKLF